VSGDLEHWAHAVGWDDGAFDDSDGSVVVVVVVVVVVLELSEGSAMVDRCGGRRRAVWEDEALGTQ
jgi:hypothetical protein